MAFTEKIKGCSGFLYLGSLLCIVSFILLVIAGSGGSQNTDFSTNVNIVSIRFDEAMDTVLDYLAISPFGYCIFKGSQRQCHFDNSILSFKQLLNENLQFLSPDTVRISRNIITFLEKYMQYNPIIYCIIFFTAVVAFGTGTLAILKRNSTKLGSVICLSIFSLLFSAGSIAALFIVTNVLFKILTPPGTQDSFTARYEKVVTYLSIACGLNLVAFILFIIANKRGTRKTMA